MARRNGAYAESAARRIMAATVKGEDVVPFHVQEAAKRVQAGRGRPADTGVMAAYLGDRRSGARGVKKAAAGLRLLGSSLENLSRESTILGASGGGALDQARFVSTVLGEVERYSKSKLVKDSALKAAELLGQSPRLASNLLKGLGRVARLGGAAAMVASAGVEIAEHYFASNQQAARAQGRSLDVARALGVSPHRRREAQTNAAMRYDRNVKFPRQAYDYLFPGAREDAIEQETTKELQNVVKARTLARELGVRPDEVIAAEAQRRGVLVEDLHPQTIAETLDAATSDARKRIREENRDQVDRALEVQLKGRETNRIGLRAFTLGLSWLAEDYLFPEQERLRKKLEQEFDERTYKKIKEQESDAARRKAAGQFSESFTVAEVQQQRRQEEAAQAQARSFRSRHKAVIVD